MKVLVPGHVYLVESIDTAPGRQARQQIHFVLRRDPAGEPLPTEHRAPGILCQELLRVLIDRVLYLYAERPCDEDTRIIEHLRECIVLFESRAARSAIERLSQPEKHEVCPKCHHLLCFCPIEEDE